MIPQQIPKKLCEKKMTSHYSEDTSSDDEALIKSLNAFDNGYESMACAFCDTLNPSVSCSLCHLVWYCDQVTTLVKLSCKKVIFENGRAVCGEISESIDRLV